MSFFKKKVEKKVKKKIKNIYQSVLIISLEDGKELSYFYPLKQKNSPKILPWRYFYKWYFARPQSDNFVIEYDIGMTMIKRENISKFQIVLRKEKN